MSGVAVRRPLSDDDSSKSFLVAGSTKLSVVVLSAQTAYTAPQDSSSSHWKHP